MQNTENRESPVFMLVCAVIKIQEKTEKIIYW